MAIADARTGSGEAPKVSLLYNPALRSYVYQTVTLVGNSCIAWICAVPRALHDDKSQPAVNAPGGD
jgi:hypothetical protein